MGFNSWDRVHHNYEEPVVIIGSDTCLAMCISLAIFGWDHCTLLAIIYFLAKQFHSHLWSIMDVLNSLSFADMWKEICL